MSNIIQAFIFLDLFIHYNRLCTFWEWNRHTSLKSLRYVCFQRYVKLFISDTTYVEFSKDVISTSLVYDEFGSKNNVDEHGQEAQENRHPVVKCPHAQGDGTNHYRPDYNNQGVWSLCFRMRKDLALRGQRRQDGGIADGRCVIARNRPS